MSFDRCRVSAECTPPRTCVHEELEPPFALSPCNRTSIHCACMRYEDTAYVLCHESDNCEDGEVCARRKNLTYPPYDAKMIPHCASEAFVAGSSLWEEVNKPPGSGLAADVCKATSQCKAPRTCLNFTGGSLTPCNGYREQRNSCACFSSRNACRHKFHCDAGEVCAETKNKSLYPGCQSEEKFTYTSENYREADYEYGTSLTHEPCFTDDECVAPRSCTSGQRLFQHCFGREKCFCLQFKRCTRSTDCIEGEVCGIDRNRTFPVPYCASAHFFRGTGVLVTVEEDPSLIRDGSDLHSQEPDSPIDTDPIRRDTCIAAHHLHHLPQESLVFSTHHISAVLCDSWDNCATRGHIVRYKSTPMMMMTYCAVVECTEKLMKVNAPAGFRTAVMSRRAELQFTALSARYETRLEEIFLSHVLSSHIFGGGKWFRWHF